MSYTDFDRIIDRKGTNCGKWDTMDRKYQRSDLIHLGVADMDFAAPKPISNAFDEIIRAGIYGYTDLSDSFYDSIIGWYEKHYRVKIKRQWIVFCPRINIASALCVNALTKKQNGVMIHTPAYAPLSSAIIKNDRVLVPSPLIREGDSYAIDFEQMKAALTAETKMLILCSPHNPTTRVFTQKEIQALGEFCVEHNLILFSDEIHGDIVKSGIQFESVLRLEGAVQESIICATSPAKTFNIPGVIVSYMIIPNESMRDTIRGEIDRIGMHNPNIFAVGAVEKAYTECEEWYEQMCTYVDENETFTREYFADHFPEMRIMDRQGTFLLWIDCTKLSVTEVMLEKWFIEKARVSVYMGGIFGQEGDGYIRLNIASPRALLLEAYERMREVYETLKE